MELSYFMFMKYCPLLCRESLHKNGQDFLDIQYNTLKFKRMFDVLELAVI